MFKKDSKKVNNLMFQKRLDIFEIPQVGFDPLHIPTDDYNNLNKDKGS